MGGVKPEYLIAAIQYQKLKKELGIPLNIKVLLSVGEVNKNKNHQLVIESLPDLKDCWYVLCGRGPLMTEHRKLAERLGVSDRFIMTGYRTDVADFYFIADIFVFPSYREGLPVALMEAMAAGLPVVCTEIRGNADLIESNRGGLYFEPDDTSKLVGILRILIKSDLSLSRMGHYNREAIADFDIKRVIERTMTFYFDY